MATVIEDDCRGDIGGDEQRVARRRHRDTREVTFKLVLLPVWIACYLYGGRTYQIMINGVSGEVQGDRPYSAVKIALAVLAAVAVVAALVLLYLGQRG